MDETRAHTRLITKGGSSYAVVETPEEVQDAISQAFVRDAEFIPILTVTGQALFPPEQLWIRPQEIVSAQEVSAEGWTWMKRMNELHYARQMQELEQTPGERLAAAQERLVAVLSGEDEDE